MSGLQSQMGPNQGEVREGVSGTTRQRLERNIQSNHVLLQTGGSRVQVVGIAGYSGIKSAEGSIVLWTSIHVVPLHLLKGMSLLKIEHSACHVTGYMHNHARVQYGRIHAYVHACLFRYIHRPGTPYPLSKLSGPQLYRQFLVHRKMRVTAGIYTRTYTRAHTAWHLLITFFHCAHVKKFSLSKFSPFIRRHSTHCLMSS